MTYSRQYPISSTHSVRQWGYLAVLGLSARFISCRSRISVVVHVSDHFVDGKLVARLNTE